MPQDTVNRIYRAIPRRAYSFERVSAGIRYNFLYSFDRGKGNSRASNFIFNYYKNKLFHFLFFYYSFTVALNGLQSRFYSNDSDGRHVVYWTSRKPDHSQTHSV